MKSAIIAAYRRADFVEENVRKLIEDGFEVIIAADEPSDELNGIIKKYGLKASVSEKRRGKWLALNDAAKLASGDVILFLDSDTRIIELSSINGCDVVELRKEVDGDKLIERLINIDYLIMNIVAKIAAKLGTCPGVNGSAFMIKKDVFKAVGGFRRRINEDTDLGIRLGFAGYKYGIYGKAVTRAPSNFSEWLAQRERWSLGGAEILVENFWKIVRQPKLWLPYIILFYPALFCMILCMLLPDSIVVKLLYLLLPVLVVMSSKFASFTILTVLEITVLRNLMASLTSFAAWSAAVVLASKKLEFRIDCSVLPIYYFIYSPLWTTICILAFVKVALYKVADREIELKDWKV